MDRTNELSICLLSDVTALEKAVKSVLHVDLSTIRREMMWTSPRRKRCQESAPAMKGFCVPLSTVLYCISYSTLIVLTVVVPALIESSR
jgi:hypothetical protein